MQRIIPYREEYRETLTDIWEASVRATHDFLAPADMAFYRELVASLDLSGLNVFLLIDEHDAICGFLGAAASKVEMLFLRPECMGKGYGKALLRFAVQELNATTVDVNEQNRLALRFYEAAGFRVADRAETDGCGKPYPILSLQLSGGDR